MLVRLRERSAALLALTIPTLAGLAFMGAYGAPQSYLLINGVTLFVCLVWLVAARFSPTIRVMRIVGFAALVLLAVPLLTGPEISDVARWIPLGRFQLHSGMITVPLLAGVAATDRENAPAWLLAGIFFALLQPDGASVFALMVVAVGLYFAWRDWQPGVVAMVAFFAGILASLRGELPAQAFVEHVLADALLLNFAAGVGLLIATLAAFGLLLVAIHQPRAVRFAMAGSFAGFSITALLSNYPTPLIGYGAAPLIGYALALSIQWNER